MILCKALSEVLLCHFCFACIFRSFFPLEDNVQVLKFILICHYIHLSLFERASFFNKVSFFLFHVLLYQNGVFRISPFNSTAAQDGMTCRKAAFYRVWSLLTQTTNKSFRGFIFTLVGDCQRVFTANLSASKHSLHFQSKGRTHKGQRFSWQAPPKSSQCGSLFWVFVGLGFFTSIGPGVLL